jgi:CD109 antigen
MITGFSIDSITGLGLTETPRTLKVFQPFFVSLNLPYSVKRGEVLSIVIVVFNYQDNDQEAEVTLYNADQEFEFTETSNEIQENKSKQHPKGCAQVFYKMFYVFLLLLQK